jgi:hypothetical protein
VRQQTLDLEQQLEEAKAQAAAAQQEVHRVKSLSKERSDGKRGEAKYAVAEESPGKITTGTPVSVSPRKAGKVSKAKVSAEPTEEGDAGVEELPDVSEVARKASGGNDVNEGDGGPKNGGCCALM